MYPYVYAHMYKFQIAFGLVVAFWQETCSSTMQAIFIHKHGAVSGTRFALSFFLMSIFDLCVFIQLSIISFCKCLMSMLDFVQRMTVSLSPPHFPPFKNQPFLPCVNRFHYGWGFFCTGWSMLLAGQLAHRLIVAHFGKDILLENGSLNRPKLGEKSCMEAIGFIMTPSGIFSPLVSQT